jgi:hypothetical protein
MEKVNIENLVDQIVSCAMAASHTKFALKITGKLTTGKLTETVEKLQTINPGHKSYHIVTNGAKITFALVMMAERICLLSIQQANKIGHNDVP